MKLLLVFVSALVLVTCGDVTPADEGSVYENKPEFVAGDTVMAGQEAEGVAPQEVFAEEAPGVGVFGAEEVPRVYDAADPVAEDVPAPESGVYIPSVARVCTNSACLSVCHRLGLKYGQCISLNTCWCHN